MSSLSRSRAHGRDQAQVLVQNRVAQALTTLQRTCAASRDEVKSNADITISCS